MNIINYFKRLWKEVDYCKNISGRNKLYFFLDGIYCGLFFGSNISGYINSGMWRVRSFERKYEVTTKKMGKAIEHFNDSNSIHLLENKADFNKHFSTLIKRDWLLLSECTLQEFENFVQKHPLFFMKPTEDMQGNGIEKFELKNIDDIKNIYEKYKEYLVEEAVVQHHALSFGGNSVNTIRMYSILDKNGEAHLLKAILRAGTGASVDNFHSGGVIYEVDLESGIVCSKGRNMYSKEPDILVHPNTNIIMLGQVIPNWSVLKEKAKQAARLIPNCKLVGWDIAITEDDVEFIEGNHNADHVLLNSPGSRCHWKEIKEYW